MSFKNVERREKKLKIFSQLVNFIEKNLKSSVKMWTHFWGVNNGEVK